MKIAWHFTRMRDGRPVLRDGVTPVHPVGEWLVHDGDVSICAIGLHASWRAIDALTFVEWSDAAVCLVEVDDVVADHDDKLVCRRRRVLAWAPADNLLRLFARECALSVADLWKMPEVVREYLETGRADLRDAAGAAAGAASWDASATVWAAAWAAGAAARDAASATAGYAGAAASDAAWAAGAASWDASATVWAAAWAAGAAARDAASATAGYAGAAAGDAAGAAASDAAWAAGAAASDAAWAAGAAASDAAWDAQNDLLESLFIDAMGAQDAIADHGATT